jgi:hypothetical protein
MSTIFKGGPGLLLKPVNSGGIGPVVNVEGLFDNVILMCSGLDMTRVQDVEYQKTLSNTIYGFAFGEGPGKIQINGYAFLSNSKDGGTTIDKAVAKINKYYDTNNVSATGGEPVSISVAGISFMAYLEIMSIAFQANATNVGSFTMTFTRLQQ